MTLHNVDPILITQIIDTFPVDLIEPLKELIAAENANINIYN